MADLNTAREWHRRGDLARALPAYRHVLNAGCTDASAWYDYAIALLQSRLPHEAIPALQEALRLAPMHFDVLLALSQAHQLCGEMSDALVCAATATRAKPDHPHGWLLLGRLEMAFGNSTAAEAALRRAVALAPSLDEAWHYLGEALQRQQRWDEAGAAYRQAMRSQPGEIMNIGICAEQAGHWEMARDAYQSMCRLHPNRRDCLTRLAQVSALLCDFQSEADAMQRLGALLESHQPAAPDDCPEPFPLSYLPVSNVARRKVLSHYVQRIQRRVPVALPPRSITPRQQLNIGYLSADFGAHAVGTLLQGLFAAHDRQHVRVLGYSLRRHHGPLAEAIRAGCDVFHDLDGVAFADIAARIRQDEVDVLIDLGGYTHGAQPEILALRPAPLQLGWLGFIHAHQAPWLDGLILDAHIQPEAVDWPFSDTVLRLPGLLFPGGALPRGTADRRRFGLPDDVPLLASFNNSYKLDEVLIRAWLSIMQRVPQAHLAVYLPAQARPCFLRHWQRLGGQTDRLHLLDHLPAAEQADRAASCDLFLDAFRYQAGATAMACIAAGLPVLSCRGDTPLARLSAGINGFLGLDELICRDPAHYIEQAVALLEDRPGLAALRERMNQRAADTGLFDPRRAAAAIEALVQRLLARPPLSTAPPQP